MTDTEFEFAPFAFGPQTGEFATEYESGRGRTRTLPTLTIRVRPFVVLDRFAHKVPTMPSAHDPIVERIARLVVASRISRQPLTTVRLVGHADSTGPANFNVGIGTQRAQSVRRGCAPRSPRSVRCRRVR